MPQNQRVTGVKTAVFQEGGSTVVTYHGTRVVVFDHEWITLSTGGWHTATTKLRMNQAAHEFKLNYYVHQVKGAWYVRWGSGVRPFVDGMRLNRLKQGFTVKDHRPRGTDNMDMTFAGWADDTDAHILAGDWDLAEGTWHMANSKAQTEEDRQWLDSARVILAMNGHFLT